ncbi:hypothetical protein PQX77_002268, partial [Marasmius sp. AFHP31]
MEVEHAKQRRVVRNQFIDDQAGVDNNEDEEVDGFIDDQGRSVGKEEQDEQEEEQEESRTAKRDGLRVRTQILGSRDGAPRIFDDLITRVEGPLLADEVGVSAEHARPMDEENSDESSDESSDNERGKSYRKECFDPQSPVESAMVKTLAEADTSLYQVKCETGLEIQAIMYLIQRAFAEEPSQPHDTPAVLVKDLICSAFMGKKAGHIYLEVTKWNSRNPALVDILHKTPGLLYPSRMPGRRSFRFRTDPSNGGFGNSTWQL